MHSNIVFLLLSVFVMFGLTKADRTKDYVSVFCQLANANELYINVANRKCITGCLGNPKKHPTILFNECEPIKREPGAVKEPYYLGIFFISFNAASF